MAKKNDKKAHISIVNAICMITVASFYDLLQFFIGLLNLGDWLFGIPAVLSYVLSLAVNLCAIVTFGLWFQLSGLSFLLLFKKNKGTVIFTLVMKFIPIINSLPVWIGLVVKVLISSTDLSEQLLKNIAKDSLMGKIAPKLTGGMIDKVLAI